METTLNLETRAARIQQADRYSIGWDGKVTAVSVSITKPTVDEFGYTDQDDKHLFSKEKSDSLFLLNGNCPVAENLEDAKEIASILMPNSDGILDVINKKLQTEFRNKVRAFLNAKVESKKAVEKAKKIEDFESLKSDLADGTIDQDEFNARILAIMTR